MAVKLSVSLIVDGRMEHRGFELDPSGLRSVADVFAAADKGKLVGRKFFKRLFAEHRGNVLTVLHNGRRLRLPDELANAVADNDEVSMLTPTVGG